MKATMKKVLSMLLVVALTAGIAITGTMAYLTMDAGDETNVFSIGNIDISLDEEVGIFGEGGEVKETEEGAEYIEIMPGDYLKKEVTVTNNGKTPAYVAVTVTLNNADKINAAIDGIYEEAPYNYTAEQIQAIYDDIFDGWGINYNPRPGAYGNDDARGVIDGTYGLPAHTLHVDFAKTTAGSTVIGANNWFVAGKEVAGKYWVDGPAEYDGYYTKDMEDYEICYTYYMLLPAGESSTLFNGLNVPAEFNADQLAMFDGLVIDIEAKAIQADNMGIAEKYKNDTNGEAKTAFSILAGEIETPEYSNKPSGTVTPAYASMKGSDTWNSIWGEAYTNAKNSLEIKVYSGDTYLGTNSLNDLSKSAVVTWHCYFDGSDFEEWTMTWAQKPTIDRLPTTVELWVDGEKVDETAVRMNCPNDLAPVTGAVVNANGEIVKFVTKNWTVELADGESYVAFVSNTDELHAALTNGATNVYLKAGTYSIPDSAQNKTLTLNGSKDAVIIHKNEGEQGCDYGFQNSTVTFNGVTIDTTQNTDGWAFGYARMNGTYNNCDIKGTYFLYGVSEFNGCTFNVSGNAYNVWTYGSSAATFNRCTFNCDGKAIYMDGNGNTGTNLTVSNCVFNDRTNGASGYDKAAIETGTTYGTTYTLNVSGTTVNGFAVNPDGIVTNSKVWANKHSMGTDKLNVVVDSVSVY